MLLFRFFVPSMWGPVVFLAALFDLLLTGPGCIFLFRGEESADEDGDEIGDDEREEERLLILQYCLFCPFAHRQVGGEQDECGIPAHSDFVLGISFLFDVSNFFFLHPGSLPERVPLK